VSIDLRKDTDPDISKVEDAKKRLAYVPSKGWAEMIRKVYEEAERPPPPRVFQQELL